jgi:hypothetical protein
MKIEEKKTIQSQPMDSAPWLPANRLFMPDNWKTVDNLYLTDFLSGPECDDILNWAMKQQFFPNKTTDSTDDKTMKSSFVPLPVVGPAGWIEKDFDWLYYKILALVKQCNDEYFKYDITGILENAAITRYEKDGFLDWHKDLGQEHTSIRKLCVHILLDPAKSGGEFKVFSAGEKSIENIRGSVILNPSWLEYSIKPVTNGTAYYLNIWLSGPKLR